jgi:hypothetical protein
MEFLSSLCVDKFISGSTCIISPVISGKTCVASPKFIENGTCLASTYLGIAACACDSKCLGSKSPAYYLNTGSTALCSTTAGNALALCGCSPSCFLGVNACACDSAKLNNQLPAYYLNTGSTIAESSVINLPTDLNYLQTQITSLGTIKSQAQIFIFEHPASDIAGYEKLSPIVTTLTGATESITVNGTALIDSYITPSTGLGVTGITSGIWTFHFHAYTNIANNSNMRFDVYTRRGTGETLQFQSELIPITTTTIQEYQVSETHTAITGLISTDRLVVKVYVVTTLNRTITWQYTAANYNAYVQVPIFTQTAPQWANIASKPSWLSGTTLGAFETGHTHSQYAPLASPNFTTCTCAPIVCATTCFKGSGAGLTGTAASLKSNDSSCLNGVLAAGYLLSGGTAVCATCAVGAKSLCGCVPASFLLSGGTAICATTAVNALCLNGHAEAALSVCNAVCVNGHAEAALSVCCAQNSANLGGVLPAGYLLSGGTAKNALCLNGHLEAALSVCNAVCVNGHAEAALSVCNAVCVNGHAEANLSVANSACLGGACYDTYAPLASPNFTTCTCAPIVCATTCGIAPDWVATSDCRLKTDIQPISNALSVVIQLQGVSYRLCNDCTYECQIGLIAQDVIKILPEVVSHSQPSEEDFKYGICDEKLGLKYDKLSALFIEAFKEQQTQIVEMNIEINKLKNKTL